MLRALVLLAVACVSLSAAPRQSASTAEQQLIEFRQQLNEAMARRDRAFLDRSWADEFYCIHSNGVGRTKAEDLPALTPNTNPVNPTTFDELKARIYGDVGIVTGRTNQQGATPLRFTDIFVKRDGRWQMVGCQATRVQTQ